MANNCDFCRPEEGLTILFTRHTIGKKTDFTSLAPSIASVEEDYADKNTSTSQEDKETSFQYAEQFELTKEYNGIKAPTGYGYLQKLLRPGYLYVYNEAMSEQGWQGYLIVENSFLIPFDFSEPAPFVEPNAQPSCNDPMHKAKALTIVIPRPKDEGTKIWFKYSNTEWTNELKDKYKNGGYRQKYMQSFDVTA